MFYHARPIVLSVAALAILSGCSSVMNTAGSSDYSCPGMPNGVVCKTPAAVYKSTHLDPPVTDFDTPIGTKAGVAAASSGADSTSGGYVNMASTVSGLAAKSVSGPRPVREPAKVARIWIAPWVDKNDNLHLAQVQYTEIKPRTWTVGKPELAAGAGYVIPHRAFAAIDASGDAKNERTETRPSGGASIAMPVSSQASHEASTLVAPSN